MTSLARMSSEENGSGMRRVFFLFFFAFEAFLLVPVGRTASVTRAADGIAA